MFYILLFILILPYSILSHEDRMDLDRTEFFSKINVNISWSINIETQKIYIEIIAPIGEYSDSWIAIGISDTGGMKGADIGLISLYHQKIYDLHSKDFALPIMDKIQNWKLDYFQINDDQVIIQISRYLITCDSEDYDIDTKRLKHNVMIAYNGNDKSLSQTTDYLLSITQHSNMERKEINLFLKEELFLNQIDVGDSKYIDYTITDNLTISKSDGGSSTQYWCAMFNTTRDIYGTGFDLLDTTLQKVVHHVGLVVCTDESVTSSIIFTPDAFTCDAKDNYRLKMDCKLVTSLATGSSVTLPSQIHYFLPKGIYIVEAHFDFPNIGYDVDIDVEGSGLRIYYSDTPRNKALSVIRMEVGEFEIPPRQTSHEISFAMHSDCTNKYVPDNGVDILFIGGHMHNLGESIILDRVRYPNKVQTIFTINQWDFNRQFAYPVHYTLRRRDTLRVKCIFNSMGKDNITYRGDTGNDEMCQVYLGVVGDGIEDLSTVYSKPVYDYGDGVLLNPSYCGSSFIDNWEETQSTENSVNVFYNNLSIKTNNDNLEVFSYTNKLCHALVFDKIDMISNDLIWKFNLPYITLVPAIILIIGILFALYIIEKTLKLIEPGIYADFINRIEDKRKLNIYVFSVIYFTIMLVILLIDTQTPFINTSECEIILNEPSDNDKAGINQDNYPHGIALVSNMTMLFFGVELFYRFKVKFDLILHHMLTIIIIICITTTMQTTLNGGFLSKIAFGYLLQIATEQPIFISLFIRKLKLTIIKKHNYPKMFYVSCIWHYITKIGTTIMVTYYYVLSLIDNDCNSYWHIYDVSYASFLKYDSIFHPIEEINWKLFSQISMGILLPILFSLQMYQGYFFWKLGKPTKKKSQANRNDDDFRAESIEIS